MGECLILGGAALQEPPLVSVVLRLVPPPRAWLDRPALGQRQAALARVFDHGAIDDSDQITRFDSCFVRGAVVNDLNDQNAIELWNSAKVAGGVDFTCQLRRQALKVYTNERVGGLTCADDLLGNAFGQVDGDGKTQPGSRGLPNRRIDADDLSGCIDEGTTAVARIDSSIGLNVRNPLTSPTALVRSTALMMPAVTVLLRPRGLPIAMAHSPGLRSFEFPRGAIGNFSATTRTTATSVKGLRQEHAR